MLSSLVVSTLSYVAPYNFPYFQEGHIPLVFYLNYFLFFFVNNARSCVSWMILSAVCISNFFQAIFLHVVGVLFPAFGTCMSSSTDFPVVSIFLAFEAPQGSWDILLDSLKTITNLHLLGSMRLIKCQDVSVHPLPFLMVFLLIFVTPYFPRADAIFSFVPNAKSLLLITPLEVFKRVGSAFHRMKGFYF